MSYSGGFIETGSNTFTNTAAKDYIIRTVDYSQKFVIGNTPCNLDIAAIYINKNSVGIRTVPQETNAFEVPGLFVDTSCNVTVQHNMTIGGSIIPTTDVVSDLGASNKRFRDLYLSGSTIRLGNAAISMTSNGVSFVDSTTNNLSAVNCAAVSADSFAVSGQVFSTDANGNPTINGTPILTSVTYCNGFHGFNTTTPQAVLHAHLPATQQDVRLLLTDASVGSASRNAGVALIKSTTNTATLWNFAGRDVQIGTQFINPSTTANIILGASDFNGNFLMQASNDATVSLQTSNAASTAGLLLDASAGTYSNGNGRKFYIRSTGAGVGAGAADRSGLLEIGDGGGVTGDSNGRSNLVVLDRFSRMWIGNSIVPSSLGGVPVGTGTSNDTQPALLIVGDSNATGLKLPLVHLGRNARQGSNGMVGFGMKLVDMSGSTFLTIGRGTGVSGAGNATYSNDIMVDSIGNVNVGVGLAGTFGTKLRVENNTGSATGDVARFANSNSFISFQPNSTNTFNPMLAAGDARIVFSNQNSNGGLVIAPYRSTRTGLRLNPSGVHELAGDIYMNGKVGVGESNPTYNLDVTGTLRATSNVDVANMTASNIVIMAPGKMSVENIVAASNTINVGCDSGTATINIACSTSSQTVNIGATGTSNTVINIGGPGDVVNIQGSTNMVSTNNTTSCNKTISLNSNGAVGTAGGAGIEIQEGGAVASYIRIASDRGGFVFKTPIGGEARMDLTNNSIGFNGALYVGSTSNVGVGTSNPGYKLDVAGAVNATTYCNLQWSYLQGVPSLAQMTNDLSNFSQNTNFNSNVTVGGAATVTGGLTSSGSTTLQDTTALSMTTPTVTVSNVNASNISVGALTTDNIVSGTTGSTMNIGCDSNTAFVSLGVNSNMSTLNIGTNNVGTVINIGGASDIINIQGTLISSGGTIGGSGSGGTTSQVTVTGDGETYANFEFGTIDGYTNTDPELLITPSLSIGTGASPLVSTVTNSIFRIGANGDPGRVVLLNQSSLPGSGGGCGLQIEENGVVDGWFTTTNNGQGWSIKAPDSAHNMTWAMGSNSVSFNSNTMMLVGGSNGMVAIGTNNPNASYKLQVMGTMYATAYANLPIADTVNYGIVRLNNTVSSTSTSDAATAAAVNTVYTAAVGASNFAATKWTAVNAGANTLGYVMLTDSTSCNASIGNNLAVAATPKAVSDTYAFAATKWTAVNASSSNLGYVYLTDSTSCNVSGGTQPIAASAKAVNDTYALATSKWTAVSATDSTQGYVYLSDSTTCNVGASSAPVAASMAAVYNTMGVATAASNRAYAAWLPADASGSSKGYVTLSDSTACNFGLSDGGVVAATPKAVYNAYQLATTASNQAYTGRNASAVTSGYVYLMDSTGCNSLTAGNGIPFAATPKAVYDAYQLANSALTRANAAWNSNDANTALKGIVYLTDSYSCNVGVADGVALAASAKSVASVTTLLATVSNQAYTSQPVGSDAAYGVLKLSDSTTDAVNGIANGLAATPKAVQIVNNLASSKWTAVTAQAARQGIVYLTDSTTCNVSQASAPLAASAAAVYSAYLLAQQANSNALNRPSNIGAGSLSAQGAVQLCDDQTNTSTSLAATINAVSKVNAVAVAALPATGGTVTGDIAMSSGNMKTTGNVWAGDGGSNWVELYGANSALIAKNTNSLNFGHAVDNAGTSLVVNACIDKNGNFGVGTTSPSYVLDVSGTGHFSSTLTLDSTLAFNSSSTGSKVMLMPTDSASAYHGLGIGSSALQVSVPSSNHSIQLGYTVGGTFSDLVHLKGNGNLGVGTSNPGYALEVVSSSGQAFKATSASLGSNVGNAQALGSFVCPDANATGIFMKNYRSVAGTTHATSETRIGRIVDNNEMGYVSFTSQSNNLGDIRFGTSSGEVARINSNGLGIGTTNPLRALDVSGGQAQVTYNNAKGLTVTGAANDISLCVKNTATGGRSWLVGAGAGTSVSACNFSVYDETAAAFRMSINPSGYVGIATTTPSYPLDVSGAMRATGDVIGTGANSFRMAPTGSAYGSFFRNDGLTTYVLLTASNDIFGASNSLRPVKVNNSNGMVSLGNTALNVIDVSQGGGVGVGTTAPTSALHVIGETKVDGSSGAVSFVDRVGTSKFAMYNSGDKLNIDDYGVGTRVSIARTTGYVGLGTTAPAYNIDVAGSGRFAGNLNWTTYGTNYIGNGTGDGATSNAYNMVIGAWQGISLYDTCFNKNNIWFGTRTGNATFLGALTIGSNVWHTSADGGNRLYFASGGATIFGEAGNGWLFQNSSSANVASIDRTGVLSATTANISGTISSSNVVVSSTVKASGEVQSLSANAFRMVNGGRGVMLRSDGSDAYFLITASNDAYGSWNSLRPFHFNLGSGFVTMENGATISGGLTVNNSAVINGSATINGGATIYGINCPGNLGCTTLSVSSFSMSQGSYTDMYCANNTLWIHAAVVMNSYATFSDARMKEDVQNADIGRCEEIVRNLPLRRYAWKDEHMADGRRDKHELGWIAQEVEKVFPNSTQSMNDEGHLALNKEQLHAVTFGALQSALQKIDDLTAENTSLKSRLDAIEAKLASL